MSDKRGNVNSKTSTLNVIRAESQRLKWKMVDHNLSGQKITVECQDLLRFNKGMLQSNANRRRILVHPVMTNPGFQEIKRCFEERTNAQTQKQISTKQTNFATPVSGLSAGSDSLPHVKTDEEATSGTAKVEIEDGRSHIESMRTEDNLTMPGPSGIPQKQVSKQKKEKDYCCNLL